MKYIKRIVDKELEDNLQFSGAILVKGPKWCGKTTTANKYSKSILEMQNPDTQDNNIKTDMAYKLESGVLVVPIGCLKD